MIGKPQLLKINYPSPLEEVDPENDNIDVHVHFDNGSVYSFLIATPNNIYWCMDNEGIDYFFGTPPVFVRRLTHDCIYEALIAIATADGGKWISLYGALQE